MTETICFILCAVLTAGGLFVLMTGLLGQFRFRDSLTRIHAAALYDTLGVLLMISGVMLAEGADVTTLKMAAVIVLLWLSSPVSSHLIARMEVQKDHRLAERVHIRCPEAVRKERGE